MNSTINDVAKAAGVSKATISRYLNDKSLLKDETAERIGRVIQELNYVPSASARNLVLGQTDKLGVLVAGVNSLFWNTILGSIHEHISQVPDPYEIFTLNCDGDVLNNADKSVGDKIHVLKEQRVAGVIIALRDLQQMDKDLLFSLDIPFVVIQTDPGDERVSFVNVDNYKATYDAAQHLIQLGHKLIAYVNGPSDAIFSVERFEGFRDALISKKLFKRSMVLQGDNYFNDGYWRMKQMLTWHPMPTAVMFSSDEMAYGAMKAVGEAGLAVPEDISLVGFDGLQEVNNVLSLLPPLTTVCQPMREIGEKAAESVLRLIRDKVAGKKRALRITLPTRFLDRGSCREWNGK
jgi:LacI family transcriptional regulator